jgi:hypothetical protein
MKQAVEKGVQDQKVDRVLSFFSSRPNWNPPPPHPQASVSPAPLVPGGTHSHAGGGVPIWTADTVLL